MCACLWKGGGIEEGRVFVNSPTVDAALSYTHITEICGSHVLKEEHLL